MSDTVVEAKAANPKAAEWAERIAAQQHSGLSVKQFCREQALTEYSFYTWRKRLQESGPVRFAVVERSARRQERTAEAALEVVLATGERLRIGPGVDITTLRTVLDVLKVVSRKNMHVVKSLQSITVMNGTHDAIALDSPIFAHRFPDNVSWRLLRKPREKRSVQLPPEVITSSDFWPESLKPVIEPGMITNPLKTAANIILVGARRHEIVRSLPDRLLPV